MKMLKLARVAVAACMFTLVTLFFLGFGGGCGLLEKVQVVPALLGCAVAPLLVWVVVTVLFGRVYCSMVCPLGILQDVLLRLAKLCGRKRLPGPRPERPLVRWGALAVFAVLVLLGAAALASLLDPYGTYGRFAAQLLQPAAEWVNNGLADLLGVEGPVVLFKRELFVRSASGFAVAASSLVLLAGLVAWKGRLVCNTVCPVGALLGMLAQRPVFRIAIDPEKCVKCGLCSGACKALCLDGRNQAVDDSRCVRCFDCLGTCPKGAISFRPAADKTAYRGRRRFLGLAGAGAVGGLLTSPGVNAFGGNAQALPPPGADARSLRTKCTACGLCVARCPQQVLAPAGFSEYGVTGFMLPKMDFSRGFCRPDCTACGAACPTGAIPLLDLARKKAAKIGLAAWNRAACLACTEKIPCGLCERRCPQKAISLKKEKIGDKEVEIPVVDPAKCTGCGACAHYCPSHAMSVRQAR